MEDKAYRYWLHNLPGVGDRTIEKLLKAFGSAREVYGAGKGLLGQVLREGKAEQIKEFSRTWEPEKEYEKMAAKGITFCSLEDDEYPARLRELAHPPYALYCMGKMPEDKTPSAAVIGARECSEYGRYVAQAFAGKMASSGVAIVSGMARGIDGIGQKAAIDRGGRTYAVLGSGVDVCYPASNKKLYQEIMDTGGGVLSVFPPGTQPRKSLFPERNRIVAGLSDVLLVVEARIKSGTWITVDMALEQGKNVYAVPGRLTDRLSDGCNLLIRQGAGIVLSPEDILAEFAVLANRKGANDLRCKGGRDGEGRQEEEETGIMRFLDFYPVSIEDIMEKMEEAGEKVELPELLAQLVELCVEGNAKQAGSSSFVKVRKG